MNRRSIFRAASVLLACLLLAACNQIRNSPEYEQLGNVVDSIPILQRTPGLDVHAVRSSKTVIVHRIAVMPLIDVADKVANELAPGAAEAVTAEVYARATIVGGWTVTPETDVEDMLQQFPPLTPATLDQNALALGRKLNVDGVIYGSVHRYRERVGYDYAAQTPAAVAFTLNFVDEKSGQIVWTGDFAKEQKALTENVLDLPSFISNSGRWVRAHDLAAQGAREAIGSLQSKITVQPIVQGQY